jgi:hypothetical protein
MENILNNQHLVDTTRPTLPPWSTRAHVKDRKHAMNTLDYRSGK